MRNIIVFEETGRYGGWPANHGIWQWGNEIVVGFASAYYKPAKPGPAIDFTRPFEICQARSSDGGESWTIERSQTLLPPELDRPQPLLLSRAIDFTSPDFALMFKFSNQHIGPSRFYTSTDRCHTWEGPFRLVIEDVDNIAARTDYIVRGKRDCLMFGSMAKADLYEGRTFCAETKDGGLNWKLVAKIGPETEGYIIMPSTIDLGMGSFLTALRNKQPGKDGSIDLYLSDDFGRTWRFFGEAAPGIGAGNPPSLIALIDGRLCLTYGYRAKPFGIRARISADKGITWSHEIVLRDDALAEDIGYPRSIQRRDGKIVTIYYHNGPADSDRTVQATIWTCS